MERQVQVTIPWGKVNHASPHAHSLADDNAPVKGWAKRRANALFLGLAPMLDEKIDSDSGAIKRACEPAGGYRSMIAIPPRRDVASRAGGKVRRGEVLVFDANETSLEGVMASVGKGARYAIKAIALVRGVPLAVRPRLFQWTGIWKKSREFEAASSHLDTVAVWNPSAEKFNSTGNAELLARGSIESKGVEFGFSICVQNPRMDRKAKVCDFAFIVTGDKSLSREKAAKLARKGKGVEEWLERGFSKAEVPLRRLVPPEMQKAAKFEWVLFKEMGEHPQGAQAIYSRRWQ